MTMERTFRLITATTKEPATVQMLRGTPGKDGAAGKDATLTGTIAAGTATAPQIPAGGDVTVTVPLTPKIAGADYVAAVTLGGTSTFLGQVSYRGTATKTASSITVRLHNSGLLIPSSAVTVDVIAVRPA